MVRSRALVLLSLWAAPASASQWWSIEADQQGNYFYADFETMRVSDEKRIIWVETIFFKPRFSETMRKQRFSLSCDSDTITRLNSISFDKNGDILSQSDTPSSSTIVPDFVGENIKSFSCTQFDVIRKAAYVFVPDPEAHARAHGVPQIAPTKGAQLKQRFVHHN